jgi:DNA mismatch repair protein MutH
VTVPPPSDEAELMARARALVGRRLGELVVGLHTKGKGGELLERALGATGGSQATWDFPDLRVELKSIPLDHRGKPKESTFVCAFPLADADRAAWETSWARSKLSRVLWIPLHMEAEGVRRVGEPLLWSPTAEQEAVLRDDFEEIVGQIGIGGIEGVSAHLGTYLQLRPKAAHGRVRTVVRGREGDLVATVPRGFYLRARFTAAILDRTLGP